MYQIFMDVIISRIPVLVTEGVFGSRKENKVSKALAESSKFGENKTEL